MIAKQIKGRDFYGVISYNNKKVITGNAFVIDSNINEGSVVAQTKEFNVVRQLRPNLSKVVYHTSLNLAYEDNLSDQEFGNLAREYLEAMGFNDNQYIIYKHLDQDHSHIHIVANRVKFSGDVVSDSRDYKRSEALVRKLEKKYNLTELVQKEESNSLTQGEIEKCLRTANVPERLELQNIINQVLNQNILLNEFIEKLKKEGVKTKLNESSTGLITGISFEYKDIPYKGSKVHRSLSWINIAKKLNYEQNRDHSVIPANNSRIGETESKSNRLENTDSRNERPGSQKSRSNLEQTKGEINNKPKFRFRR
jgi:hypothetical protein